jgi:molybdopterin biosynthesis enzyme
MSEYSELADQGEDLAGIAAHKNALAIATGAIVPSKTSALVMEIGTATDEETGFTITVRRFTDVSDGAEYFVTECLAGRVVGDANQAYRIVAQ